MISYYDLIKSLYTEEEFQLLLKNELQLPDDVDLTPGSGFHHRERKHYPHAKKQKNK